VASPWDWPAVSKHAEIHLVKNYIAMAPSESSSHLELAVFQRHIENVWTALVRKRVTLHPRQRFFCQGHSGAKDYEASSYNGKSAFYLYHHKKKLVKVSAFYVADILKKHLRWLKALPHVTPTLHYRGVIWTPKLPPGQDLTVLARLKYSWGRVSDASKKVFLCKFLQTGVSN
jgi:hypothetical protein